MTLKLDFVGDGWHYTYIGSAHNVFTRLAAQLDNGNIKLPTQVVVSIERNSQGPSGDDRSDAGHGALLAEKEDDSPAGSGQRLDTGSSEAHRAVVPQPSAEMQAGPHYYEDVRLLHYVKLSADGENGPLFIHGQVRGVTQLLATDGNKYYQLLVSPTGLGGTYNVGQPLWTLEEIRTEPFDE